MKKWWLGWLCAQRSVNKIGLVLMILSDKFRLLSRAWSMYTPMFTMWENKQRFNIAIIAKAALHKLPGKSSLVRMFFFLSEWANCAICLCEVRSHNLFSPVSKEAVQSKLTKLYNHKVQRVLWVIHWTDIVSSGKGITESSFHRLYAVTSVMKR